MDFKLLLITLLGLAATATDPEIMDAAKAFADKEKTEDKPADDAKPADGAEIKALSVAVKGLSDRFDDTTRAGLLAGAAAAGKLVPLSVQKLPIADLTAIIAELPAGAVPITAQTTGIQAHAATVQMDESISKDVCRQLGISEEDYKKAK